MSVIVSPEKLAAGPATKGIVDPAAADQTLGAGSATHRFASLVASGLATLAETVTNLVRATGAALVLRSNVGTSASDVCVKVGTSVSDGSVNSSAKLWSARTGIGGTEVEKLWVDKNGDIRSPTAGVGRFRGSSASLGYVSVDDTSGTKLVYGNQSVSIGSHIQFSSDDKFLSSYVGSGTMQSSAADGASAIAHIINTSASWSNATARLLSVRTAGAEKLAINASGRIDQSGTDSSGTPGNANINKPIGKSAIASGATTVDIKNSLVARDDHVDITWHGDLGAQSKIPWVTTADGKFTVNVGTAPGSAVAFCWRVSKRI